MEYLGHTQNAEYFNSVSPHDQAMKNLSQKSFRPHRTYDDLNTRTGFTLDRSLTAMPWRPDNYSQLSKIQPSISVVQQNRQLCRPLSMRCSLTELEGIKVPPVYSAARNSLYTRYSANDWLAKSKGNFNVCEKARQLGEQTRVDAFRLGKETDDKTKRTQEDVDKKLDDRMNDIEHWKRELNMETDAMITEIERLDELIKITTKLLFDMEKPLHIAQECLYNREKRQGVDLVHDAVEKELLMEIDTIKTIQNNLKAMLDKMANQQKMNREAKRMMEIDSDDKFKAWQIDGNAKRMNNHSPNVRLVPGVENINNCICVPESWQKFTSDNINRSQSLRDASRQLREECETLLGESQHNMLKQFGRTNQELTQRIQEYINTRNASQHHLTKLLQEIFEQEKILQFLKKCIADKEAYLKVAQSRLEIRLHRDNMERCRDQAQTRLLQEVYELRESVEQLKSQLNTTEDALQVLMKSRFALEKDIAIKDNSIFIDREKCLGIRKTFPIAPRACIP